MATLVFLETLNNLTSIALKGFVKVSDKYPWDHILPDMLMEIQRWMALRGMISVEISGAKTLDQAHSGEIKSKQMNISKIITQ